MVPDLLSVRETSALLRIARLTVYHLIHDGEIPVMVMVTGGQYRVPSGRLLEWLDESRVVPFPHASTWDRGGLLTLPEVATAARVDRITVNRHVRAGTLECVVLGKAGRVWRIWEDSARRYLGTG